MVPEANKPIKLNVGGYFFYTSFGTLTKYDSMLNRLVSGDLQSERDDNGFIFIDRDGKEFDQILNFLRDGYITNFSNKDLHALKAEATFYQLQPLIDLCSSCMETYDNEVVKNSFQNSFIGTSDRLKKVVASNDPSIVLFYNEMHLRDKNDHERTKRKFVLASLYLNRLSTLLPKFRFYQSVLKDPDDEVLIFVFYRGEGVKQVLVDLDEKYTVELSEAVAKIVAELNSKESYARPKKLSLLSSLIRSLSFNNN
uniref:BTB domain-containing protein n=1 Tax=Acrobeloides nanus TaxID=290746 RepID=A0A914EFC8_9BILA